VEQLRDPDSSPYYNIINSGKPTITNESAQSVKAIQDTTTPPDFLAPPVGSSSG